MNRLTITLTPAQKAALTDAYQTLRNAIDSNQFQRALEILRTVSPKRREEILQSYPRLAAIIRLGRDLRID